MFRWKKKKKIVEAEQQKLPDLEEATPNVRGRKYEPSKLPRAKVVSKTSVKNPVEIDLPDPYNPANKYGVDDRLLAYFYTKKEIDEMDFGGGGDNPDAGVIVEDIYKRLDLLDIAVAANILDISKDKTDIADNTLEISKNKIDIADNSHFIAANAAEITEIGAETDLNTAAIEDIDDYLGGVYFEISLGKERWTFDTAAVPREGNFTSSSYDFDIFNTEFWINEVPSGFGETGFDKARAGDKMNIHLFNNPSSSFGDYVITSIVLENDGVWKVKGDFVDGIGRITAGSSYEIEILHGTKKFATALRDNELPF